MQFQEVTIGQHFEFRGRRYQKLAVSLARDEDYFGNVFQAQTEVLPDPFSRPRAQAVAAASPLRPRATARDRAVGDQAAGSPPGR